MFLKCRMTYQSVFLLVIALMPVSVNAWEIGELKPDRVDFFVGIDADRLDVEINDVSFHPLQSRLRAGLYLWRGVGLELSGAIKNEVDEDGANNNVEARVESYYSAALRLQSPDDGGWSVYTSLGRVEMELFSNLVANPGLQAGSELGSHYINFGFIKRFDFHPNLALSGQYDWVYEDDNVDISSMSLGLQYAF